MDILYLLVPLSVVLVFVIGAVFWYAVDRGQFDDLEGPGLRILTDDDSPRGVGEGEGNGTPKTPRKAR
jgi:cbb3-type cytochrome oxidase maturation protein